MVPPSVVRAVAVALVAAWWAPFSVTEPVKVHGLALPNVTTALLLRVMLFPRKNRPVVTLVAIVPAVSSAVPLPRALTAPKLRVLGPLKTVLNAPAAVVAI